MDSSTQDPGELTAAAYILALFALQAAVWRSPLENCVLTNDCNETQIPSPPAGPGANVANRHIPTTQDSPDKRAGDDAAEFAKGLCYPQFANIGLRGSQYFAEKWHLDFQGDLGGFRLDEHTSHFDWSAMGLVTCDAKKWLTLSAGYRALASNAGGGSGTSKKGVDIIMPGLLLAASLKF